MDQSPSTLVSPATDAASQGQFFPISVHNASSIVYQHSHQANASNTSDVIPAKKKGVKKSKSSLSISAPNSSAAEQIPAVEAGLIPTETLGSDAKTAVASDMNKTRKRESRAQAAHTAESLSTYNIPDYPVEAPQVEESMTRGEISSVGLNATNSDVALKESAKSLKKTKKAHSSEIASPAVHEQLQVVEKMQDEKVASGKAAKKSVKSKKEVENNNSAQGNAHDTTLETKPQVLQESVAEPVPKMSRTDAPEVITLATPEPLLEIVSQVAVTKTKTSKKIKRVDKSHDITDSSSFSTTAAAAEDVIVEPASEPVMVATTVQKKKVSETDSVQKAGPSTSDLAQPPVQKVSGAMKEVKKGAKKPKQVLKEATVDLEHEHAKKGAELELVTDTTAVAELLETSAGAQPKKLKDTGNKKTKKTGQLAEAVSVPPLDETLDLKTSAELPKKVTKARKSKGTEESNVPLTTEPLVEVKNLTPRNKPPLVVVVPEPVGLVNQLVPAEASTPATASAVSATSSTNITGSVSSFFGTLSSAFASFMDPELPPEEAAAAKKKLQDEVVKRQMENNAKFAAISQMIGLDAAAAAETGSGLPGVAASESSAKNNNVLSELNAVEKGKKGKKKVVLIESSSDADSDSSGGVIVVKRVKSKKSINFGRGGRQKVNSDSDSTDSETSESSSSSSDDEPPSVNPRYGHYSGRAHRFSGDASRSKSSKRNAPPSSMLGRVASTFTSILEPELTPEEKAMEKKRKAQEDALARQMANQRQFAKNNRIEGLNVVDSSKIILNTTSLKSGHTFRSAKAATCMPIAEPPASEEEFEKGLKYYNNRDFQWATTHWERAIKIDNNAEALRMLIELYGPSKTPNAAKAAEYMQRRRELLKTPAGMLNHGRHLARVMGSLDGPGIVLVRSAADLGHAEACYEFGMYLRGKSKGAEAMGWLHQAADGGFADAEEAVAEGYEKGLAGAPVDAVAGAAWRARVVARIKAKEAEESSSRYAKEVQAKELLVDSIVREKERLKVQQGIKQREENLIARRAMDPALNSALRNLEWGFYASAIDSLHELARSGNVDASDYLDPDLSVIPAKQIVAMYHIGEHLSCQADPVAAVKWFRRSSESGYHEAQVTYAAYLIVGKGLESADPGQAMAWLMKAWENGSNKEAALALGEAYTKGIGVAPDPTKAVKWYTRAWEAGGYSEAAFAIGLACATGFTPGAVDPAAWNASGKIGGRENVNEVLNKRSDPNQQQLNDQQETPPASKTQSPLDSPGKGTSSVPPKPMRMDLIGVDSELASLDASSNSSRSNSPALSTIQIPQLAKPPPTNTLNSPLLKNVSAFKQDVAQAAKWYKKASDLGHSRACNNLGELHMTGRGVKRNDVIGFGLFRRAAMAGLPEAEYNMGRCCREGRGCTQNEEQARMWFRRAEEQGIEEATTALAYN
ncbi:hypothetical protein HDU77_001335 [Chytriomyces hyalinus]|nr:hypothetical protein HDU77_001335 [Chytriomyces hyalinus]